METAVDSSLTSALFPALPPVSAGSSGTTQLASGTSGTQVFPLGFNTLTGSDSSGLTLPAATSTGCGFTGTQTLAWQPLGDATVHYFPNARCTVMQLTKNAVETTLHQLPDAMQPPGGLTLTACGFFGTNALSLNLFETAARVQARPISWASPDMLAEYTSGQRIFDAIQALYLSHNSPRDRQIAERLTTLYRAALEEDETIRPASISQFTEFFLAHSELGLPKITLTPDGTLRARWIHGKGNFVALEFAGEQNAKLVAEIPRDNGLTATHFGSEPLPNIVAVAQGMGASFA